MSSIDRTPPRAIRFRAIGIAVLCFLSTRSAPGQVVSNVPYGALGYYGNPYRIGYPSAPVGVFGPIVGSSPYGSVVGADYLGVGGGFRAGWGLGFDPLSPRLDPSGYGRSSVFSASAAPRPLPNIARKPKEIAPEAREGDRDTEASPSVRSAEGGAVVPTPKVIVPGRAPEPISKPSDPPGL